MPSGLARLSEPGRFIAICRCAAFVLLVLATTIATVQRVRLVHRFEASGRHMIPYAVGVTSPLDLPADFPQFYMGGVIARHHIWEDMYPIPSPGSNNNPGEPADSVSRPRYEELAQQTGVKEAFRYILSPPATLLLWPISFLPFRMAAWTWIGLSVICAWAAAVMSGAFYGRLVGRNTYVEGVIVLLLALAPDTRRSTNPGNLSPMIALLIGLTIWGMLQKQDRRTGLWIVIGGVLKYVTAVFLPLLIAMRRWRTLGWTIGIGLVTLAISVAIMGTDPFFKYIEIFPTLNRPFIGPSRFNQTFYGLAWDFYHQNPLPAGVARTIHIGQLAVLGLVLGLIFRRKRTDWQDPAIVIGGGVSLLMWLMLFSPVVWIHYVLYVSIFFGWVVWEATRPAASWAVRIVAIIAMLFLWTPYSSDKGLWSLSLYHQPMSLHVFYAELAFFAIALRRLMLPTAAPLEALTQENPAENPASGNFLAALAN